MPSSVSPSSAYPKTILPTPGRFLLTLVAFVTSTGCYLADWNETHIYNPTWPSHAKFHNGQTMSMGALLGMTALWYIYGPRKSIFSTKEEKRNAELQNLRTVVVLDALYWITQASAYFYPGSGGYDPIPGREWVEQDPLIQAKIEAVLLMLVAVGWWLERRRILNS